MKKKNGNSELKERGMTYIDIELSNEAGEIVVFEVIRKKSERKFGDVIDDETVIGLRPTDDGVGGRILNHIVTFGQERCH